MTYEYTTKGTCSKKIRLEISEDGIIESVSFTGGCQGNLSGLSKLVSGMKAEDVIERLEGTRCGFKDTSCPDQLSKALKRAVSEGKA